MKQKLAYVTIVAALACPDGSCAPEGPRLVLMLNNQVAAGTTFTLDDVDLRSFVSELQDIDLVAYAGAISRQVPPAKKGQAAPQ